MQLKHEFIPSAEEITLIIQNEIEKQGKRADFDNFIYIFKEKNFNAIPYFKQINKYVKTKKIDQNKLLQLLLKFELADIMLKEGAKVTEIKKQTDIPDELLAILIKKYYSLIPKEIIQLKLTHFRLMQVVENMHVFYKNILECYTSQDKKDFVETFYQIMIDMVHMNKNEFKHLDIYTQILRGKDETF